MRTHDDKITRNLSGIHRLPITQEGQRKNVEHAKSGWVVTNDFFFSKLYLILLGGSTEHCRASFNHRAPSHAAFLLSSALRVTRVDSIFALFVGIEKTSKRLPSD